MEQQILRYDVFLSFRGIDTRNNFTGHLYNSLQHQNGIQTFIDDEEIQKGEQITPALLQAIKETRIFIVIFSPNYASSTFCLTELDTILEFSKLQGRLFLPIFYDVDPSHIRNITGTYAEAFAKLEARFIDEKEKVQKWRDALHQAASVSGWHFKPRSELEYKFIEKIVEKVSMKINRVPLHVANNPVGLKSRVLEVISLLGLESGERVNKVGIYGMGGIGKSTIARAVHNFIADQFEGVCFLADIREREIHHGLVQLQETLLSEILGEKDIKVGDVYKGISIIKRRLQTKKVLLILDDVDKKKQLQALVGGHDWFGSGSKIIITTRDKHLLATHGIVKVYEVKQLENEKALDLFSWHAFKNKKIDSDYVNITNRAVSYCHGLPLALEVIGSHLYGKSLDVWTSSLDKCERVLHGDIHAILKVSYDYLDEDVKGIFLDIACFFDSFDIGYVKEMLYYHGFHEEDGIQELTDKSLMKIDVKGRVRMHDMIQDMGREIVRQESTLEPGSRSRLWFSDDIVHVLEENKGTDTIEVIIVNLHEDRKVNWCGNAFGQMKNLRILIIRNAQFSRGPQILPDSLRMLDWCGDQSSSLPFEKLNKEWLCLEGFPLLKKLCITKCPKLKSFPLLKKLCITECPKLKRVPPQNLPSLQKLEIAECNNLEECLCLEGSPLLKEVSIKYCRKLKRAPLPQHLPSLQKLKIIDCEKLEESLCLEGSPLLKKVSIKYCSKLKGAPLPQHLHSLQKLKIINCQMLEISIPKGDSIIVLYLEKCDRILVNELSTSLKKFVLRENRYTEFSEVQSLVNCTVLEELELDIRDFVAKHPSLDLNCNNSLRKLSIIGCHSSSLPFSLHLFTNLLSLDLTDFPQLESFPRGGLPSNLRSLKIENCPKLIASREEWGLFQLCSNLRELRIFNCPKLIASREEWGLFQLNSLISFLVRDHEFENVESFPEENLLPPNFHHLELKNCSKLRIMNYKGFLHLNSLTHLRIDKCPSLESLPEEGLQLSSLYELYIYECPLISEKYKKEGGERWHTISHIPVVWIDLTVQQFL